MSVYANLYTSTSSILVSDAVGKYLALWYILCMALHFGGDSGMPYCCADKYCCKTNYSYLIWVLGGDQLIIGTVRYTAYINALYVNLKH